VQSETCIPRLRQAGAREGALDNSAPGRSPGNDDGQRNAAAKAGRYSTPICSDRLRGRTRRAACSPGRARGSVVWRAFARSL